MMNSRGSRVLLPALLASFLFCASNAQAASIALDVITVRVDENCHGSIDGFLGLQPLGCSFTTDPGPGGLAGAMTYNLMNPPGLVGGDVVISEPGGSSDLIRFAPTVNGGSLFFYSDLDGGADALADIGLPTGRNTNLVTFTEASIPGGFGLIYTPTANQPGFVAGAALPVQYIFVSDSTVPEPGTLILVGSAMGALIANRRRRQGQRRT